MSILLLYPSKKERKLIGARKWKQAHPEKVREYSLKRKSRNRRKADMNKLDYEKLRESQKRWKQTHPEKTKEHNKNQYRKNPKKVTEQITKWRKANQKKVRETQRMWRQENPQKARQISNKKNARRNRELDYITLNEWFKGSVGHHIDKEYVIYIPVKIHRSHIHNLKKPETMRIINAIALYYLAPDIMPIFKCILVLKLCAPG